MTDESLSHSVQQLHVSPEPDALKLGTLPHEIQDHIFHFVVLGSSRDELKKFRLSNRYFKDRADIYLFSTLHVSASILSLERVRRVAENDRLNVHVRELVFHRGTFSGHRMVRFGGGGGMRPRDFDVFETYMVQSSTTNETLKKHILRISQCYDAFVEEVAAEAAFNRDSSWRFLMKKYCSRFPKLDKLTTLSAAHDLFSNSLSERCGTRHQSWSPNYFAPYEIFDSCGPQFRFRALSFDMVNGEDFAMLISNIRGGPQAVTERFSKLESFRLGFSETVAALTVEGTYDIFIQACTNLRQLSLNFFSFRSARLLKDPHCFPQVFLKLLLGQQFPKLESLNLTLAIMTEHDFISFLERHRMTLRTLVLNGWSMPVDADLQPTGSIIRAFYRIGQIPMATPRSVTISGGFSNRADGEGWVIRPDGPFKAKDEGLGSASMWERMTAYLRSSTKEFPIPIPTNLMDSATTGPELLRLEAAPDELGYVDATFMPFEHFHGRDSWVYAMKPVLGFEGVQSSSEAEASTSSPVHG